MSKRNRSSPFIPDQNWKKLKHTLNKPNRKRNNSRYCKGSTMSKNVVDSKHLINPLKMHSLRPRKAKRGVETNIVALDCEMVGIGVNMESALARVCVLNYSGEILFEEFARPKGKITDYRTKFSGIRPYDILPNKVRSASDVSLDVRKLIGDKIIVGHSLENDFKVLKLRHPLNLRRDTAHYPKLQKRYGRKQKLKYLAAAELGWSIQNGEHNPYIDARAALEIYKKFQVSWENSLKR